MFKSHSVAEFFEQNKQMLGLLGPVRMLTQAVHEYLTNSLDACEEAGILPDIFVRIDNDNHLYRLYVKDNGPGLPPDLVGPAFGQLLAGTKFHALKQYRGQQGMGASAITLLSLVQTGRPVRVESAWQGRTYQMEVTIDLEKNRPVVKRLGERAGGRGLAVEVYLKDVRYDRRGPLHYVRLSHLINPHARLVFVEPDGQRHVFQRRVHEAPPRPREVKPHPLGIDAFHLLRMAHQFNGSLWRFLNDSFSRMSRPRVYEIIKRLDLDPSSPAATLDRETAERIVEEFRRQKWTAPEKTVLRRSGEYLKHFAEYLDTQEFVVVNRRPSVYNATPFAVDVFLGIGRAELLRFANFTPLMYDAGGCTITETFKQINWSYYGLSPKNLSAVVHLTSIKIPYSGPGKQSIASVEEIRREIANALKEAGRRLAYRIRHKKEIQARARRLRYLKAVSSELADALAALTDRRKEEVEGILSTFFRHLETELQN